MQGLYDKAVFAADLRLRDSIFSGVREGRAPQKDFEVSPREIANGEGRVQFGGINVRNVAPDRFGTTRGRTAPTSWGNSAVVVVGVSFKDYF